MARVLVRPAPEDWAAASGHASTAPFGPAVRSASRAFDPIDPRAYRFNLPEQSEWGKIKVQNECCGKNLPVKGEKRLGASPNRFPGCVLEVVLND